MKYEALLFDLDGVVFDTEHHYTKFWSNEAHNYHPENPKLAETIKGLPLFQILDSYFGDVRNEHSEIVRRLDLFEEGMTFDYIDGFCQFVTRAKQANIKTAIVTSSTEKKMSLVKQQHPELNSLIDVFITADMITKGKPHPDCYLAACKSLEVKPENCIVFEDSINGLKSGMNAGARVIALQTTLPSALLEDYSEIIIENFNNQILLDLID